MVFVCGGLDGWLRVQCWLQWLWKKKRWYVEAGGGGLQIEFKLLGFDPIPGWGLCVLDIEWEGKDGRMEGRFLGGEETEGRKGGGREGGRNSM